jgi:hypothetical protein
MKNSISLFFLILSFHGFGQITNLNISDNVSRLQIKKSKEKFVIKTLGKPDSIITQDVLANLGGGCIDYSYTTLIYLKLGLHLNFKGHYQHRQKRKLSEMIILEGDVVVNETIKVGKTSLQEIKTLYGIQTEKKMDDFQRLTYKMKRLLVTFSFNSFDVLESVQIQQE